MTELSFQTVGGLQRAELHEGALDNSPIVVVAPAIGIKARYYEGLCSALAGQGIGAVAIDMPGHGESPIRAGRNQDWGYRELVDHFEAAVGALTALRPDSPIYFVGHSLGGHIALMVTGRSARDTGGVILVASGVPYWRLWNGLGAVALRFGATVYRTIARLFGYFPGHRFGFAGREARTLISDWAISARTGFYNFPTLQGEELLSRPGPPVVSIGLRNDFFAPEQSIRHLLSKLTSRHWRYETWESPPHRGDHNRWPSEPNFVVDRSLEFIEETRT